MPVASQRRRTEGWSFLRYVWIRLILAVIALALVLLPVDLSASRAIARLQGSGYFELVLLFALGFVEELIPLRRLRVSRAGVSGALVTLVVLGFLVALGTAWGVAHFGSRPFGIRIESGFLAQLGSLLTGVLTAKALFSR